MSDQSALITNILQEGREEANKVLEQARHAAHARTQASEQQCRRILEEAEKTADGRVAAVERNGVSRLEMDRRREQLRVRDTLANRALEGARRQVGAMQTEPNYREVLADWIVEAAVGLGAQEATVNATATELALVDDGLLRDAQDQVHHLTGRRVKLTVSQEAPLLAQGVVLATPDGRVAFSNQVETRILRLQSQIRALILGEIGEER